MMTTDQAYHMAELQLIVEEVLPLAKRASCGYENEPGEADDCCRWGFIVQRIEAVLAHKVSLL